VELKATTFKMVNYSSKFFTVLALPPKKKIAEMAMSGD
jgi:hypothetical protein